MATSANPTVQAVIDKNETWYNSNDAIEAWEAIKQRHRLRDEYFLRHFLPYFRKGRILELGAATGNLAAILQDWGHDVTASDFSGAFVGHMNKIGLNAVRIDVTKDFAREHGKWPMILAQGVSPLCFRDEAINRTVLENIHNALEDGGRVLSIFGNKWDKYNADVFHQPWEQIEIVRQSGLFRVVKEVCHQVTPPGLYRPWNAPILNFMDFALARIACVRKAWILEKI